MSTGEREKKNLREANGARMAVGLNKVVITKRKCLVCNDEFKSRGPQNRMCDSCRWANHE